MYCKGANKLAPDPPLNDPRPIWPYILTELSNVFCLSSLPKPVSLPTSYQSFSLSALMSLDAAPVVDDMARQLREEVEEYARARDAATAGTSSPGARSFHLPMLISSTEMGAYIRWSLLLQQV